MISQAEQKQDEAQQPLSAEQQIANWNHHYQPGTNVTVKEHEKVYKTRTQATLLFGHRAAIYLEEFKGYFALADITAISY